MNHINKYEQLFDQALNKLNVQQRRAVDAIEGPVLVNAGPGTGKTQILATRIGKILRETDAAPHNILCLTFTDAATIAMRNRLVSIIGPTAHQIHIYTFHGFCNQVIQENMDVFGGYRQLEPITDIEKVEVYQQLLDNLPDGNILKRYKSSRYYEKPRLENLFRVMKSEDITPDEFHEIIEKHCEDLKSDEKYIYKRNGSYKGVAYKKGDFKQKTYNQDIEKYEALKAGIDQFKAFNTLMLEHERYDYDDMILWVLEAFETNEQLLLQYQERYHYFLVDEYQDTNGAQNNILNHLISYWDVPNVFVVGDDDQAIYKFQGANLRNMMAFKNRYNPLTIVLEENYRSNQHILDASKQLIRNNKERIIVEDPSLTKDLKASGPYSTDETLPKVLTFEKISQELAYVSEAVQSIAKSSQSELSQTAIIYRNHKQVNELVEIFEKKKIKYNIKKRINILELTFIKNLLNILEYISDEYNRIYSAEARLYNLMHYSYFKIPSKDIATIVYHLSYNREKYKNAKLRDFISNREYLESLSLSSTDRILWLSENIEKWMNDLANCTLQILFQNILNDGDILSHVIESNDRAWLLQLTSTLFDFIKNETAKAPETTLKELLKTIDKMNENAIPLAINKNITSEQGVHFVTAHSAKGLEFKNVFMLSCTKDIWDKKKSSMKSFSYPSGVNSSSEVSTEDERRLFYVGMTRAEKNLYISYSEKNEEGKDLGASQFVDEVLELERIKVSKPLVMEDTLVEFYYDILRQEEVRIELINTDLIDEMLKNYKMSVTHLNKYLKCPISFYFEQVLRVPQARNAYTGFGNAMHDALRYFLEQYRAKKLKDISHLIYFFEDGMKKYKSHFTDDEFESYMTTGKMTLEKVYEDRMEKWLSVPKFALEEGVEHAEVDGIPLKGFLDKVEIFKDYVNVVDYKTGNPANASKKTKRPDDANPNGGDYWRQLVFYKLLLISDKKHNWNMVSGEVDFLEPDRKKGTFSNWQYVVTQEDIDIVSQQIRDTFDKIKAYEFSTGCGEDDCRWCNFVTENELILKNETN